MSDFGKVKLAIMCEIRSFYDWLNDNDQSLLKEKPWLILGKGPTFSKHIQYDLSGYNVIALNHVVEKIKVNFAHVIDIDVLDLCQSKIDDHAAYLVMPWVPHSENKPGKHDLIELIQKVPLLNKLSSERRLLFYNHVAQRKGGSSPLVDVRYFSAEAVVKLLAISGVKKVRTLGVDGGDNYSDEFNHLNSVSLLSNGRQTFNKQFAEISKTVMDNDMDFAPLDVQNPIKIYVAATEAQMLSVKVLEYSIKKHCSMGVQLLPLHLSNISIPRPKYEKNWPRTPFSFQRFLIPALQQYEGRAIYLDSDMQVFKDIKNLWVRPFNGAQVLSVREPNETGRRSQFSVMLLDCNALNWNIEDIVNKLDDHALTYEKLMYEMAEVKTVALDIESAWNSLESYHSGETALLHYTDMNTQPWVSRKNPLSYLWFNDLFEAIDKKFISVDLVKEHVDKGYIRPSIIYQIENRLADPLLLPKAVAKLDRHFDAPFLSLQKHYASPWVGKKYLVLAHVRHFLQSTGIMTLAKKARNFVIKD